MLYGIIVVLLGIYGMKFVLSTKYRNVMINGFLVVISAIVTYILIECFFFRIFSPWIPLKTQGLIHEGIRALAQSSKRGTLPEDYIMLVGDSYAQGGGDWFRSVNKYKNPAFHSAHIIHEELAKDVISFGAGGSGSLRGLVAEPISQFEFINATMMFDLEPPEWILVYLYEGNDLNNNVLDVKLRFSSAPFKITKFNLRKLRQEEIPDSIVEEFKFLKNQEFFGERDFWNAVEHVIDKEDLDQYRNQILENARNLTDEKRIYDAKYFREFLKDIIHESDPIHRAAMSLQIKDNLFVADMLHNMFGKKNQQPEEPPSAGNINKVLIHGQIIDTPDNLQGPALELTDEEIRLALYVFEQSLLYLSAYFQDARIGLVYIPSVLSSYTIASSQVSIQSYEDRGEIYPQELVRQRSDMICSLVQQIALRHRFYFIDSRPFVWERSADEIIHGPSDWTHFNKRGYSALARAVVVSIESF